MRTLISYALLLVLALSLSACDSGGGEAAGAWTERAEAYPSGPYGTDDNATVKNHLFRLPDGSKFGVREDPTEFTLEDNVFRPGAEVLLLVTAAEWCTACRDEAPKLQSLYEDLHEQGLEIVTVIFEDADGDTAGGSHAANWKRLYHLTHPVVADDGVFDMGAYYDANDTPLVMVIKVSDMTIAYKKIGFAETDVRAIISALL